MLSKLLQQAAGNAGAGAYVEDVFSTYLYTGNGSTQTITNGIDLSTKGGLVWLKGRSGATDHALYDTARGTTKDLVSNSTAAETTQSTGLTAFNTTGFSIGALAKLNTSYDTYASWTFRKAKKFFDVVTYTGTGSNRTVAHNLGSVPGCIIVKRTDTTAGWQVYHRSLANTEYLVLNTTAAAATGTTRWNSTTPTSTVFSLGTDTTVNASGGTYVAYLYAHDAGGFGLSGTDNVITCGSYTGNGGSTGPTITLGYEPQWLLVKPVSNTGGAWQIGDVMRDMSLTNFYQLLANSSAAELNITTPYFAPTPTGFQVVNSSAAVNGNGWSYIYIAIRRGPMKTPESGTEVFSPIASSAASGTKLTTNFPVDMQIGKYRSGIAASAVVDRLRGVSTTTTEVGSALSTSSTAAEGTSSGANSRAWDNTGFQMPLSLSSASDIFWNFRRAPGFFDVVCYTGTGSATTFNHNLGVSPELMIVKDRAAATNWFVYSSTLGATKYLNLNQTSAAATATAAWNDTAPTSTVFTVGTSGSTNSAADTHVAYLFATVSGVSKVGSYTGTGTTLQINCGFSGGARFVLIKRTDSTGDWYVWDSARGIVAGNDPYLRLNSTAAEVTTTDYVDTYSAGFEISSTAPAAINANGGTFIYLAIA